MPISREPVQHRRPTAALSRPTSVRARIDAYNADRIPELVERKYEKMTKDPFVFFRGTAHLFWEDWPSAAHGLDDAPLAWSCGDLHLENFGSYRGENRLAYFDLNDFDDAALAPATRDPARFLVTVFAGLADGWLGADSGPRRGLTALGVARVILLVSPPYDLARIRAAGRLLSTSPEKAP